MSFPKVRSATRYNPIPDLTPLADVAWLICIFLMLTTRIRPADSHLVDLPTASIVEGCCHAPPNLKILIDDHGRVWLRFSQVARLPLVDAISKRYQQPIRRDVANRFLETEEIGFGPQFLLKGKANTENPNMDGISSSQVIADWLDLFPMANLYKTVVILGDQNAPYPAIEKVFSALQARKVNRFSLLTTLEREESRR